MKESLSQQTANLKHKNNRHKRWKGIVSILACMVVFCTVYALILPALTAEGTPHCGKEEHTHTEDCYEKKLICGKEEGEGAHHHTDECYREEPVLVCTTPESDGHQHTDDCYTEEQVLTCTNTDPDHVHNDIDGCYTTERKLTCGKEEGEGAHHHTEECYETKRELICGQEESDGHKHTDDCYKKELVCGKEEHKHILACYSDPNADVEDGNVWQRTVSSVTLTGNWGADLVAIAKTQSGYTESTANYAVAEDGQTIHGYTRYGAWANDPYRDNWSAQFADFCLSYAGVPTSAVPQNNDCNAWNYTIPDGYTPKTGDLLLLDTDSNGSADHAGIVTTADDSTLTAIVGDADKAVRNNTYNIGSENIKGYVSIPENPALAADNNEEEITETTPAPEVTEEPQETPAPEVTPEAESTQEPENKADDAVDKADENKTQDEDVKEDDAKKDDTANNIEVTPTPEVTETPETTPTATPVTSHKKPHKAPAKINGVNTSDINPTAQSMSSYITGITGDNLKYNKDENMYSTNLKVNFKFNKVDIQSNGYSYYYEYEDGIIIPDKLIDGQKHELNDGAGTYQFAKTSDGKYRLLIEFNKEYVEDAGDTITGNVEFSGKISGDKGNKDGNIEIKGQDGVELIIPKNENTYPSDETNAYDISVSKQGTYQIKDGKLVYTVYVSSLKGTPSTIAFQDKITVSGVNLGEPNISVIKESVPKYGQWNEGTPYNQEPVSVNDSSYSNGVLKMTLPKIEKAIIKTGSDGKAYKEYTRYKIEYIYDVTGMTVPSAKAENTVNVSSKDQTTEIEKSANTNVTITNEYYSLNKTGWFDSNQNKIKWTITVNENQVNIAGSKLTDDMLAKLANGTNISIQPSDGYTIKKDGDGKITDIQFNAVNDGKNSNKYTIEYWTDAERKWEDQKIDNTVHFEPGDGKPAIDKTGSVTVYGGSVEKKFSSAITSSDGLTAEIPWTVILNVTKDGLPKDLLITDNPRKESWNSEQYMTAEQVKKWADGICWLNSNSIQVGSSISLIAGDLADISFLGSDGKSYTYEQAIKQNNITFTVWTVKLNSNITVPDGATKLVFRYSTTADLSTLTQVGSAAYYKNTVTVGDKTADASYEYKKGGLIKTDENNKTDPTSKVNKDGTLTWKVKAVLTDESSQLKITDTLPDGVNLVSIKGEDEINGLSNIAIDEAGNISGNSDRYQVTGTYQGNKATIILQRKNQQDKLEAKVYTLVLTCRVDKESLTNYKSGETYTFVNHATAKNDQGSMGSPSQSQEWTESQNTDVSKVIDKTGKWDNNTRRVNYSINLNPEGKDIVEGSELMTLRDVLSYYDVLYARPATDNSGSGNKYTISAELLPATVKLYKASRSENGKLKKEEEVTNWSWTVTTGTAGSVDWQGGITHTSTIVAENVPDSTPLILEYGYQFSSDIPKEYQSTTNITVKNTATLEGTVYKDDKEQNDTKWDTQDHSGYVSTNKTYTLYKVSKGNYGKLLPGAEFKLQKYDNDNGKYQDTNDAPLVTNTDGKIVIRWQREGKQSDPQYEYNTLYRVVETAPPDGYNMPDHPESEAIYFYFSNSNDGAHVLPDNLPSNACDLTKNAQVAYIQNEAKTTEITVNKKWLDRNGNVDTTKTGKVTVNLYRNETTDEPGKGSIGMLDGKVMIGDWGNGHVLVNFDLAKYQVGTQINLKLQYDEDYNKAVISYLRFNGKELQPTIQTLNSTGYHYIYEYSFRIVAGVNKLEGVTSSWQTEWKASYTTDGPVKGQDHLVGSYEVTSTKGWSTTIDQLPAFDIKENGEKVYYTYHVKEVSVSGYDTSYDNNGGIGSGIITIINKQNQSYVLPETGGTGTNRFTVVGLALMAGSLMCEYVMRRKRRERRGN